MNDLRSSKQDERVEEMLEVLESMEQEMAQKDTILQKKDNEIQILQEQLNESLNLCEKLNGENKAENVQALKNELKQTRELLQSEKEKKKRADSTIEECQDKLRQAEREKEYALMHQKKVEIPVEKPVLYERCRNCDRKAYQQVKERYEHQRNGLEKKYKAKTVGFDVMIKVLWWYAIVTTIFAAMRSEIFLDDITAFFDALWNGIRQSCEWIVGFAKALAQVGDRIPNEMVAIIVHWLLFIIVIIGAVSAVGVLIVIVEKKVTKVYRENCWDVVSVGMAVISLAVAVYLPEGTNYNIGKFGHMRCEYLKEFKHGYYMELLLDGRLNEYLYDIDEECHEMLDRIVEKMKEKQGVTEQLKAENQMLWVGKMNNIIACAEEVVVREVVYV